MSKKNHGTHLLSLPQWETVQLRLTAFTDPEAQVNHSSWWQDVFGAPPDVRTSEPKTNTHEDQGSFEDSKPILRVEPGRVDWLFRALGQGTEANVSMGIGPYPETREQFCELMSRWLGHREMPEVSRLAFGAVVVYPVESREIGYKRLDPYLPCVKVDPDNSQDFLYQINRPSSFSIGTRELRINRLSIWSVMQRMHTRFSITPNQPVALAPSPPEVACRLQLDINTMPDYPNTLPTHKLADIFKALVDFGEQIMAKGELA